MPSPHQVPAESQTILAEHVHPGHRVRGWYRELVTVMSAESHNGLSVEIATADGATDVVPYNGRVEVWPEGERS